MDPRKVCPWWTEDGLYPRLSEAIGIAERHGQEDPNSEATKKAYRLVSIMEELVAAIPNLNETEKAIARRGAINAATKAGDVERATMLKRIFKAA